VACRFEFQRGTMRMGHGQDVTCDSLYVMLVSSLKSWLKEKLELLRYVYQVKIIIDGSIIVFVCKTIWQHRKTQ